MAKLCHNTRLQNPLIASVLPANLHLHCAKVEITVCMSKTAVGYIPGLPK